MFHAIIYYDLISESIVSDNFRRQIFRRAMASTSNIIHIFTILIKKNNLSISFVKN